MSAISYTDDLIILRVKAWQTADKYAVCFSRCHGKLSFIAYGAKYPKSLVGRLVQPLANVSAELQEGQSVDKLKGCELLEAVPSLSVQQLAYGALAAEVTELLTEYKNPQEEIYELLEQALRLLVQRNPRLVVLSYITKLLEVSGFGPVYQVCVNCSRPTLEPGYFSNEQGGLLCRECGAGQGLPALGPGTRRLWQQLQQLDFERPESFTVKGGDLMELEKTILSFLVYQVEKPLKSLAFLAQL